MLNIAVVGGWWGRILVDLVLGRAPYPVPRERMIANVSALEAIFRSAASGIVEKVEGDAP
jgi:hypothetical protein